MYNGVYPCAPARSTHRQGTWCEAVWRDDDVRERVGGRARLALGQGFGLWWSGGRVGECEGLGGADGGSKRTHPAAGLPAEAEVCEGEKALG
jgi:hypothetical protein